MSVSRPSPARRTMPIGFALAGLLTSLIGIHAQTPAPAAPRTSQTDGRLPVRRVVLYKSGVGYFEHLGRVRGDQRVTIDFTSGQLNDVLKSLTTLDLDGGRVTGVSYNSEASLDRRLGTLRLPVGDQPTRAQFLSALRGARLDVDGGGARVSGRLLGVESIDRRTSPDVVSHVDAISIVTDAGEIRSVALDPGVSVRIAEADVREEVGKYLALIASVRDQDVRRLTIATAGTGDRDLFVSYVSEVPVWKSTYRLVLPAAGDDRRPLLQGWAIVDNTVGEDWSNVELSLVAGAPQSFIQQISQPYYVQRPVVPLPDRVLLSPQTHQGALGVAGAGVIAGTVTDSSGGAMPGATVRAILGGETVGSVVTDVAGRYRMTGVGPGRYTVTFALSGFRTETRQGVSVSGGMESVLNVTLNVGSVNESMTVATPPPPASPAMRAGGGRGGVAGGTLDAARASQQIDATAAQLGDLFEYKLKEPVTIAKNQSALVPIVGGEVTAEKVSLWNANAGAAHALRALWLTNTTGLTLDGGSFSVIEAQAFAGEGLMDPLKAGERRLLSYAADLGVQVNAAGESVPTRVIKIQVSRGVVIQQTEERQRLTYTARNEDTEARTLVVEHPARAGWTLGGTVMPAETTAAWHRFRLTVPPKTTQTFQVEEIHPLQTQFSVNAITDQHVALFVREQVMSPALEAALRQVVTRKAAIARLGTEIAQRTTEIQQITSDQERVRENMKSLKGSSEEKQLLQRYVRQLDGQESRLETLRREQQSLTAEQQRAQAELAQFIGEISG